MSSTAKQVKQEDLYFVEEAQDDVRDRIIEGLNEFNAQNGFEYRREPFSISYRPNEPISAQSGSASANTTKEEGKQAASGEGKGAILAGLTGHTSLGQLYIELLWVDKSVRGQGVGKALMDAAESFARRKGCRGMYIDTLSFQAEIFYKLCGFSFIHQIHGCGHDGSVRRIFLGKVF